jgi:hypothetical protein
MEGEERMSEETGGIGELAKALSTAQAKFEAVGKDKTAKITGEKAYSYSYADLASVLAAVRKPLSENGLAIVQVITWGDGHSWLVTKLLHSSGQYIESTYPLREYTRPQEMGSALTYARRYSLTALLGIAAEEDDDGASAQAGAPRDEAPRSAPPKPRAVAPKSAAPTTAPATDDDVLDPTKCPACGTQGKPQKYVTGGKTHFCPSCAHAWGVPA